MSGFDAKTDATTARSRAWVVFVLAFVALFGVDIVLRRIGEPPAARPATIPAGDFSAERALAAHERVFQGGAATALPHPAGSAEHEAVRERIVSELRRLGLAPVVEESVVFRSGTLGRVFNVIVPPARRTTREAVLLCAHYDSVAAGPGAGDDGAGVATLLEIARATKDDPGAGRPFVFLFDDAEEMGLLGAQAFVESSAFDDDIGVVINLDARGTRGPSRMFETSPGNADLIDVLVPALPHPSLSSCSYEVYKRMPNDTDLTVFKQAGIAGYNFAFVGGGRRYHTPLDDLAHLDHDTVQQHGENALALARALRASKIDFAGVAGSGMRGTTQGKRAEDAVYTDIAGMFVLRMSAAAATWIAIVEIVLIAAATWFAWRRKTLRAGGLARSALFVLTAPLLAGCVLFPLDAWMSRIHPGMYPWPSGSILARATLFLGGATGVALAAFVARTRAMPPRAVVCAAAFLTALAGFVLAWTVTGASYVFVVPGVIGVLAAWNASRPQAGTKSIRAGAIAMCAAQALVLFPLLHGVEEVFEFHTAALPTVVGLAFGTGVAGSFLGVYLAGESRRTAALAAGSCAVLALGAFAEVVSEANATPEEPLPMQLAHVVHEGAGRDTLLLRPFGAELPPDWEQAAAFGDRIEVVFPWWPRSGPAYVTDVERADASGGPRDGARVDVLATHTRDDKRGVRVRFSSPSGARHVVIQVPARAELVAGRWRGGEFSADWKGPAAVDVVGFAREEFELEFVVTGAEPLTAELLELESAGAGPLGELARSRPAEFVPRGEGDLCITARTFDL